MRTRETELGLGSIRILGTVTKLTRSARHGQLAVAKSNPKLAWLIHACHVHDAWWRLAPG